MGWVVLLLALGTATPDAGLPWHQVSQTQNLTVWARDVPGSQVKELKAAGLVDARPAAVFAVLHDLGRFSETMPYTKVSRVLEADPAGRVTYLYSVIEAPVIANRDYTLKVTAEKAPSPDDPTAKIVWETANGHPKAPPPQQGLVRLGTVNGSWELKPFSIDRTFAVYHVYSDPGGALPAFVVNQVNSDAVGAVYDALRTWAKRAPYSAQ
jgi:hypothetical protein